MRNLRVLIIEDNAESAETLKRTLVESLGPNLFVQVMGDFKNALETLKVEAFDAIVLDIYQGDLQPQNREGQKVWETIWSKRFVPVAVHSAGEIGLEPEMPRGNPFVKAITKKANSDLEVAEFIKSMIPSVEILRSVGDEFHHAMGIVLKEASPLIWEATKDDERIRPDLLLRATRRRLAALMDLKSASTGQPLLGMEQYIFPPVEEFLLTGDILRKSRDSVNDPATYRLVLSPSCDMQLNNGKTKINSIIAAKCRPVSEFLKAATITVQDKKAEERIMRALTEPHQGGFIPLPEFRSLFPCMAANLRDVDVIAIDDIDPEYSDKKPYSRVVSVDSPFREFISWAYIQVAGRPSVPERDLKKWANEIMGKKA